MHLAEMASLPFTTEVPGVAGQPPAPGPARGSAPPSGTQSGSPAETRPGSRERKKAAWTSFRR